MGIRAAAVALFGGGATLAPPVLALAPHVGTYSAKLSATQSRAARAERQLDQERSRRIGGAGTRITSGAIESLDQNTALRGAKWYGSPGSLGIAQKMLRDSHVRQSIAVVYSPLLAATWRFRPASDSPIDRESADFCNWAFIERLPWHEIIKRTVSDYCAYGFALAELTDASMPLPSARFPLHSGGGMGVVPTGVHQIPAWTVWGWKQSISSPAQTSGVVQYVQGSDVEPMGWPTIPGERLLRWTWDQEGANFEGLAILRSAYAPWKMKIAFQTLAAMKHERLAVPAPVAIASEEASDDDIAAVETILQEMRANAKGYLVLDNGWQFSWQGATASDGSNIEAAISQCNQDILFNVSAGFMLLGLTGKSGSYALGATQQGQYHLSEMAHARHLATGWNLGFDGWSPVERIVRLNYGDGAGLPRLEARNLPTADWAARIPLLINATNVGLVRRDAKTENAIREALEFDPFDLETELPGRSPVALLPSERDRKTDQAPDDGSDEEPA